jgi:hypothetical protein
MPSERDHILNLPLSTALALTQILLTTLVENTGSSFLLILCSEMLLGTRQDFDSGPPQQLCCCEVCSADPVSRVH